MNTPLTTDNLEHALRAALPPEYANQAAALARALVARRLDPALHPALKALAGQEVESGGALITFGSGSQMGDVTIAGDVIGGDKLTISLTAPVAQLSPQERRNRRAMLQKVRAIWVDGLLKHSLPDVIRIELGLTERLDAVQLPLNAQYQELNRPPRNLPMGTRIIDAFDASGGSLLILGAPGAGKTTLLLELCRDLLARAEQDVTQPIPVVFNLSSWMDRRSKLGDWLVEELSTKYEVPPAISQQWINSDALLPLLDGLDEVAASHRSSCMVAIDRYCASHLIFTVVSSRISDYEAMPQRLRLRGAVLVRPLTQVQVDTYMQRGGDSLAALRVAIRDDVELQSLATTPLLLNVMSLSFADQSPQLYAQEGETRWLWNAYVRTTLKRRNATRMPPSRSLHSLRWLAQQMISQSQSVFYIERLHRNWFSDQYQQLITLSVRTAFGLIAGLVIGVALGIVRGAFAAPAIGLGVGSLVGLAAGTATNLARSRTQALRGQLLNRVRGLQYGMITGLTFGLAGTIVRGPAPNRIMLLLPETLAIWVVPIAFYSGMVGIISSLIYRLTLTPGATNLVERLSWSWGEARRGMANGGLLGLMGGIFAIAIFALAWWDVSLQQAIPYALTYGGLFTLVGVLIGGSTGGLQRGEIENRIAPNQGIRRSAAYALVAGILSAALALAGYWGVIWLVPALGVGPPLGVFAGFLMTVGIALTFATAYGGLACLYHIVIRLLLVFSGATPWDLHRFLDAFTGRALLRRVGGGHIFIHRLLMEHIAAMTDQDISQLSSEIAAGRR